MVYSSPMKQRFKSVYYSDYSDAGGKGPCLTLAFGKRDQDVYERIRSLSSLEVREALGAGSFREVKRAAEAERLSVNTYCLRKLRSGIESQVREPGQLYLTGVYVDPIHATFRGGEAEPLHMWYPFLEGYSPKFVEHIIQEFAPSAERVFDPFAGTGTTPLTAARMGLTSFYCELNPLFQHIIRVKVAALTSGEKTRERLLALLSQWAGKLDEWLAEGPVDRRLAAAYETVFEDSQFFSAETFAQVLRARTLVDDLACSSPLAADFLACAVASSLVPASLLKRAGDLRYKTEEELKAGITPLAVGIKDALARILSDLSNLEYVDKRPLLVCEDAKQLASLPRHDFDCVVTSPPYLNGTNYFRNSRLELWFLRCLAQKADLSSFREKAVTAGINAVQESKRQLLDHPEVAEIVRKLESNAYDARIPRMVGNYFYDMALMIQGMTRHLIPGACVALDIGDSSYAGVSVPTDRILKALFVESGFRLASQNEIRKRASRDGTPLRQVLLIFAYEPQVSAVRGKPDNEPKHAWRKGWLEFKEGLPHQKRPFAKRNWGHPLHSLCSYQGKMKPSLAHHLLKVFVEPPARVLDPFAGVGTIPFEAGLLGMASFAFEISPAAYVIAAAKCGTPDRARCERVLLDLEAFIAREEPAELDRESAKAVAFNGPVEDFYEARTLREVLLARRFFRESPPTTDEAFFAMACVLHLLHGNRPYALSRRSHNTTPFAPTGDFEHRPLMPRLREKVARGLDVEQSSGFERGRVFFQDATSWWPQEVRDLDAVITSPPFFDSTRFHLANWLRLWFAGWDYADFKSKPQTFLEERQKGTFDVYEPIFRQARERLKPGGLVVLHLGKSPKCDMAAELSKTAAKWFRVLDVFDESVRHCESHGVRDKGTVADHQYLVLA
ncbi:MAG: hypothetical protein FJ279_03995 [Planctomycetes bacterium]|nr:hypothetical protein [Planctomycetota bacterium]